MTDTNPLDDRYLLLKLLELLHEGFVDARLIGYRTGDERLTDLADTFEIIPHILMYWRKDGPYDIDFIRHILKEYHAKHGGRDYANLLEMDDDEFEKQYLSPHLPPDELTDEARAFIEGPASLQTSGKQA